MCGYCYPAHYLSNVDCLKLQSTQQLSFTQLFSGSFDGWTITDTESNNFSIADGTLLVEGPDGWLKSDREYGDFELDVEFRFMTDDADSGIFVRATGTEPFSRGWPNQSYQVQMLNPLGGSPYPPVGALFRHGMPDGETTYKDELVREISEPTGVWQTLFITAHGSEVSASLNGVSVMNAQNITNPSGYIGIQGETGAVEFRSLKIREL